MINEEKIQSNILKGLLYASFLSLTSQQIKYITKEKQDIYINLYFICQKMSGQSAFEIIISKFPYNSDFFAFWIVEGY